MEQKTVSKITHRPLPEHIAAYEEWLTEIIPVAGAFDGHRGVSIIRPHGDNQNYTILLHFESDKKLNGWLESRARKSLIAKAQSLLQQEEHIEIETGFEFWFTPEDKKKIARPYKQFLVTSSAIYPLTLIIPYIVSTIFEYAGIETWSALKGLLGVLIIVALMVYVIMPRYTRLLSKWLYR